MAADLADPPARCHDAQPVSPWPRMALALCATFTAIIACASPPPADVSPVRDSAGVTIVTQDTTARPELLALGEPLYEVGSTGGIDLTYVFGAVRLADGSLVVHSRDPQLLVFDSTGKLAKRLGRRGGGPGEFKVLNWIARRGPDSIATYDGALKRLTVFTVNGPVRDVRVLPVPGAGSSEAVAGLLSDGSVVLTYPAGGSMTSGPERIERDTQAVAIVGPDGKDGRLIGVFNGQEMEVKEFGGNVGRSPRIDGPKLVVATTNSRIVLVDNAQFRIDLHDSAGGLERSIRRPFVPRKLTEKDIDAHWDYWAAQTGAARPTDVHSRSYPAQFPALGETVIVDLEGNIWVGTYVPIRDQPQRWWQISPEGKLLGQLDLPGGMVVFDIGPTYLVAAVKAEDETELLRVYPLRASTAE